MEESPRAPHMTRSGFTASSISSLSVSRMRPERTMISTLGISGLALASSTATAMESLKQTRAR